MTVSESLDSVNYSAGLIHQDSDGSVIYGFDVDDFRYVLSIRFTTTTVESRNSFNVTFSEVMNGLDMGKNASPSHSTSLRVFSTVIEILKGHRKTVGDIKSRKTRWVFSTVSSDTSRVKLYDALVKRFKDDAQVYRSTVGKTVVYKVDFK